MPPGLGADPLVLHGHESARSLMDLSDHLTQPMPQSLRAVKILSFVHHWQPAFSGSQNSACQIHVKPMHKLMTLGEQLHCSQAERDVLAVQAGLAQECLMVVGRNSLGIFTVHTRPLASFSANELFGSRQGQAGHEDCLHLWQLSVFV